MPLFPSKIKKMLWLVSTIAFLSAVVFVFSHFFATIDIRFLEFYIPKIVFLSLLSIAATYSIFIFITSSFYIERAHSFRELHGQILKLVFLAVTTLLAALAVGLSGSGNHQYISAISDATLTLALILGILTFKEGSISEQTKNSFLSKATVAFPYCIGILFIISRLALPLFNKASFVDEYYHIFSGIDFFQTRTFPAFINDHIPYARGKYVAYTVGAFFLLFGKSLYVAKLVPATVGIINFWLLYKIGRYALKSNFSLGILLLVYSISPWVIFNDFFIRFFVFYELFFLLIIYSSLLFLKKTHWSRERVAAIFIFLITNNVSWFLSHDNGKYFILLTSLVSFICIFVFHTPVPQTWIAKIRINLNDRLLRVTLVSIASIAGFFTLGISGKINQINNGILGVVGSHNDYSEFFFHRNSVLSLFFLIGITGFFAYKSSAQKIIILIGLANILLLFSFNTELQAIRILLFFLPLFYLITLMGFELVATSYRPAIRSFLAALILGVVAWNYPSHFFTKITVPNETIMNDTDTAGTFLANQCIGKNVYVMNVEPQVFYFYIQNNYSILYLHSDLLISDLDVSSQYQRNPQGQFRKVFKDLPVITNGETIKKLVEGTGNCFLMYDNYNLDWRYIDEASFQKIKDTYSHTNFKDINVYYN